MLPKFKHKQLKFNEGNVIYSIGDEAKNVYLIHSGHISIRSKHGLELGNLGPGEIFGEVGRVINSPLLPLTLPTPHFPPKPIPPDDFRRYVHGRNLLPGTLVNQFKQNHTVSVIPYLNENAK